MPTSEIIAVEETELNNKQRNIGKWQKMAKPHAFTGKHASANYFFGGALGQTQKESSEFF